MSDQWLMAVVSLSTIFLVIILIWMSERKHRKIMDELKRKRMDKIFPDWNLDDAENQTKINQAVVESMEKSKLKQKTDKFRGSFLPRIFKPE